MRSQTVSRIPYALVGSVALAALVALGHRSSGPEASKGAAARPVPCPTSDGLDFPVGDGDAAGYYNAQEFGENNHLGEDWNGKGGGDTDLGDEVLSISSGRVLFARDLKGGWGKVVRVRHNMGSHSAPRYVESLYAHLDEIRVTKGQCLKRGQNLGTIGTAHGKYLAHLHFELRDTLSLPVGPGYAENAKGRLHPTDFIRAHRPRHDDF